MAAVQDVAATVMSRVIPIGRIGRIRQIGLICWSSGMEPARDLTVVASWMIFCKTMTSALSGLVTLT